MNVCIFLGPTLPVKEAKPILDAVYMPPAAQGDVYLAVTDGAEAIGIVDGYFHGAPSVWHKEILWAMSRGVHVFGSASMGALRAAELAVYGMQGIGRIFEAYRDGVLTDDDEVAVIHGPEEMGYRAKTVPLVNIRATLASALEQALITREAHETLVATARSLCYWDRTYNALIDKCETHVDRKILAEFSGWVIDNAVDQKRDDAIEMLGRIGEMRGEPLRIAYEFQRTSAWDTLTEEIRARTQGQAETPLSEQTTRVLDELRLEPDLYRRIRGVSGGTDRDGLDAGHSQERLVSGLIESGHYDYFTARALDKRRVLSAQYGDQPEYADAMLRPSEVLEWYFDSCGTTVPMDLEGYATEMGLASAGELCRLLLRELLYTLVRDVKQINGVPI